jgi:hypothetical protein
MVYAKNLVPLENMFLANDSSKSVSKNHEPYKRNIVPIVLVNIGFENYPKILYIRANASKKKRPFFSPIS